MSESEINGKQLYLNGTIREQKSVLLFLELEVFKMLYLTYPICILSRLSFNLPVFVQLSSPLIKCGAWHGTPCS